MTENLKTAREAAAKAAKAAQEIASSLRKVQAEGGATGELQEKFDKAFADFKTKKAEEQREESLAEATAAAEHYNEPAREALRKSGVDPDQIKGIHRELFNVFVKRGPDGARDYLSEQKAPREAYALLGTQDDLGGFVVPEDWRAEVIKDMAGLAAFRSLGARVVPTSRSELVFPAIKRNEGSGQNPNMYTSGFGGTWRKQGEQGTDGSAPARQDQPTFGQIRVPVHTWQPAAVVLPAEFVEDVAVPIDSILAELIAETKAMDEDYEFINGAGVDRPMGILHDAGAAGGVTAVNSGDANLLKYAGLVDLYTGVPAQYRQNGKWLMNSATYGDIIKLESTAGFPLFPPNSLPGTLFSKPVVFSEWMPDVGANAFPIVFGDWRHYLIAERADLRIQRLMERFAPNVAVLPTARLGGKPARYNAFRVQKVAA